MRLQEQVERRSLWEPQRRQHSVILLIRSRLRLPGGWRDSVSISFLIRSSVIINLPSNLASGTSDFSPEIISHPQPTYNPHFNRVGRGLVQRQITRNSSSNIHVTIRTWLLGYWHYSIFVPMMEYAQLIISLIRRDKHRTWPHLKFCAFPGKNSNICLNVKAGSRIHRSGELSVASAGFLG